MSGRCNPSDCYDKDGVLQVSGNRCVDDGRPKCDANVILQVENNNGEVKLRFYAWADSDHLLIKKVTIDWPRIKPEYVF